MVTLVIPIYNMRQYMKRCLDTILNQTLSEYEIVLVDDGSIDDSLALCYEYSKRYPDIVRVIHKENGGLSSARNAGIEVALGEFIIFPDPDDWVNPEYVEQFLALQKRHNADLVCLGHYIEFIDREIPANDAQKPTDMNGAEAQKALLIPPCMSGFAWNKLYRLDIIRDNNLRFENDVGTTEDLDFSYRYLKYCSKVYFDPTNRVYHYYQRPGAATHSTFSVHKLNSIHTYEKILSDTKDPELKKAAEVEICNLAINLLWQFCDSGYQDTDSEKKLRGCIRHYKKQYLSSKYYGFGRKIQCIIASVSPKAFCFLKNRMTKEN